MSLCPIGGLVSQIDLLTQNVRKMSAQLERDQQRMASLSHELRTPLTGMIATLDLLERTELNDEQLELIYNIINPQHWSMRFNRQVTDVALAKNVAKESNL